MLESKPLGSSSGLFCFTFFAQKGYGYGDRAWLWGKKAKPLFPKSRKNLQKIEKWRPRECPTQATPLWKCRDTDPWSLGWPEGSTWWSDKTTVASAMDALANGWKTETRELHESINQKLVEIRNEKSFRLYFDWITQKIRNGALRKEGWHWWRQDRLFLL